MTALSSGRETPQPNQPAIYQMKVTLVGVTPSVWRRFQVRSDMTFYELHRVLQILMGWRNFHLYLFSVAGVELSDPVTTLELGTKNAEQTLLSDLLHDRLLKFRYEYDFANRWEHAIEMEKRFLIPDEGERPYPICLAGERACPPEDSGGSRGYARFLKGKCVPHPFASEAFDVEKVNQSLVSVN